jgi:thymidylate synthase (FAD)
MHETTPSVFLIARPSVDLEGMRAYLRDVGGESWLDGRLGEAQQVSHGEAQQVNPGEAQHGEAQRVSHGEAQQVDPGEAQHGEAQQVSHGEAQQVNPGEAQRVNHGELLLEFGGRTCYRSWEPGLNPNVSKIRTDRREYFANILRSGHGSVLEHANYSFVIRNCSRVFTHELVRHRAGSAFSQESLRYVRLTDIGFRVPPALEPVREQVLSIVEQLEEFQVSAAAELGIDQEGVPFHVKKEVTSALRRLAPIGLSTDIVWTANVRTLRHVIEMRTAEGAEEELRLVFDKIARVMQAEAPNLFQDFARQDDGTWVPENRKV